MNKPKEILELEQIYGITLKEGVLNKYGNVESNCYVVDAEGTVTQLNLSYNQLTEIKGLENFVDLQRLDLDHNQLTEIKGLDTLVDLQELDLSYNQLTEIKGLKNLVCLQELYLYNNQLAEIKGLETLVGLQILYLSSNQLTEIKGLETLVGLRGLYLYNNQLVEIKGIENLVDLQQLSLFSNQLTKIEGLETLVGLRELILSHNQLTEIKILANLVSLQKLSLSDNQLRDIEVLANLVGLQRLDLSINQLRDIKVLANLIGLQVLDLSYNQLTEVKVLTNLVGLQELNLSHNQLTDIKVLANLDSLRKLNLSDNQLTDIKITERLVDHLDYLRIDNNPFLKKTDLLLEGRENHRDIILKYFSDLKQETVKVTLPAKVMLLGNHASGKTTFRHYMLSGELTEQDSTHILNIVPYQEEERTGLPKAILFDFGGQDYYHGLYQAFFSEDPIYMLFWCKNSNRNDVQQANDDTNSGTRNFTKNYWMHQLMYVYTKRNRERKKAGLEEHSFSEPLLLIQTYAEDEKETTDKTKYREEVQLRLENTVGEYYISLKKGTKEDPRQDVLRELQRECVKTLLLREIEKKREPKEEGVYYTNFLEYILAWNGEKCVTLDEVLEKYGREESHEKDKRTILEVELDILNRKGLVLYYKENDLLRDVVCLNPAETVKDIHDTVLSKKEVKIKYKGIVPKDAFERLCSDEKIRELLKYEEVIFFDEKNRQGLRYIIPGYLPLASEDEYYELLNFGFVNPNFTLKFRYFIPFGLINQLICLYGGNPNYKKFWRDQLVFTYNEEYMLWIKLNFSQLTIAVYIHPQQEDLSKRQLTLNEVEKTIYRNILDLYWGREVRYQTNRDSINLDVSEKKKEKVLFSEQVQEYLKRWKSKLKEDVEEDIPEDMYLSIGEDLFVRATDLEKEEKKPTTIAAYGLIETEEKTIKGEVIKVIASVPGRYDKLILYKNFTNNKYIRDMKKIFISYSTKDEKYKDDFMLHTKTMQEERLIDKPFACSDIELGAKWDEVVKKELNDCDFMVCLVSKHFLNSDYIRRVEVKKAMEQDKKLIPIVVRPCDWINSNFGQFQAALHNKCISIESENLTERTENERDAWWVKVIEEMREKLFKED
jgi:internalin A